MALNNGEGILVFFCGIGILILHPWALKYGRRLPYIVASIVVMWGLAFGLAMTSVGFFYAYTLLSGFGSAPSYSTIESSILDVSFLHQRGTLIGLYGLVLTLGNFLPPIAAGYIIDSQNWQWCFKYLLIFVGISTLFIAFGLEETLYNQIPQAPVRRDGVNEVSAETSPHTRNCRIATSCFESQIPQEVEQVTISQNVRHRYLHSMTLFRRNLEIHQNYFQLMLRPFLLLRFPAILFATWMVSIGTFLTSVVFTTQASFFSVDPYDFSPAELGLMYFALAIGNIFGYIWGGPMCDYVTIYLAKKNHGVSEAEHRLLSYAPIPLTAAGGILLYGIPAYYGMHWIVPCIGMVLIGFTLSASLPITMSYAFECYPAVSGETILLCNFMRNAIGGAWTFVIQPWINYNGVLVTSIIMAMIVLALNLTFIPLLICGKRIRRKTEKWYIKCLDHGHQ